MKAPAEVQRLVERFGKQIGDYKSGKYNETQLRLDYLDPFFNVLGWDVSNKSGEIEAYRDVLVEEQVSKKYSGRVDYAFKLKRTKKFFVEAKQPRVDIKEGESPAFQIREYGWFGRLSICVLSDFEEFAIYNTRYRPKKKDKADRHRLQYFRYDEYLRNWDFFQNTFSKQAVTEGSLEKLADTDKDKEKIVTVDAFFLDEIEGWRKTLASDIARHNKDSAGHSILNLYDLNLAVQTIIDRIIFLKFAESRGMEAPDQFQGLEKSSQIYASLDKLFLQADKKYNSGLFKRDEDREFIAKLQVGDPPLKKILKFLEDSSYGFQTLPIEILGSVYERFLGKTIYFTQGENAKVEEKPETRKAGGVYYTPEYIVSYIVENTLGELLKNKKPSEVEKIRVLDPACGSGSFLVNAYEKLLNWHLEYYSQAKNAAKALKERKIYEIKKQKSKTYRLSIMEKQRILLNNIYGVDIDRQAVEVSKLSLLLKLMEDENVESEEELFKHSDMQMLPDLSGNIKCGNSLISSDFYEEKEASLFPIEERMKVNAFDWDSKEGFGEIMKAGGFDVVIGNPPYVKEYTDRRPFELVKQTRLGKYYQGKMDLWYIFASLSIDLLRDNGFHSFIAQNNWITSAGASSLRQKILSEAELIKFVDFKDFKVFAEAGIQTMIYVVRKNQVNKHTVNYIQFFEKNISISTLEGCLNSARDKSHLLENFTASIPKDKTGQSFTFVNVEKGCIIEKIQAKGKYFLKETDITNGIHHHHDKVNKARENLLKGEFKVGDGIFVISESEKKKLNLTNKEKNIVKPEYTTEQLKRYYANPENTKWVIYTTSDCRDSSKIKSYPNIKKHLDKFKKVITSDFAPYGLHRSRKEKFFIGKKILSLRKCIIRPAFTYADFNTYVSAAFYVIKPDDINLKYLTCILNSNLIKFWLKNKGKMQGANYQIDKEPLLNIPIVKGNSKQEKAQHDRMAQLVDQMLAVQKKLRTVTSPSEKAIYQKDAEGLDRKIDALAYELYGLTEKEIKIVEGATG